MNKTDKNQFVTRTDLHNELKVFSKTIVDAVVDKVVDKVIDTVVDKITVIVAESTSELADLVGD